MDSASQKYNGDKTELLINIFFTIGIIHIYLFSLHEGTLRQLADWFVNVNHLI